MPALLTRTSTPPKVSPSPRRFCAVVLFVSVVSAQSTSVPPDRSDWLTFGYDVQRTGWNRAERTLSPANVGQMRREWKTVLPNRAHGVAGLSAPLVVTTPSRELVIVAGSDDHVFALEAATGARVW